MSIKIDVGLSGKVYASVKTERGNEYREFDTLEDAIAWVKDVAEWAKE